MPSVKLEVKGFFEGPGFPISRSLLAFYQWIGFGQRWNFKPELCWYLMTGTMCLSNAKCIILVLLLMKLPVKAEQMCCMGQRLPQMGKNRLWFKGIKLSLLWSQRQCSGRTQLNVGWIKTSTISSNSIWLCCFTAWDMWSGVAFCMRWQLVFFWKESGVFPGDISNSSAF